MVLGLQKVKFTCGGEALPSGEHDMASVTGIGWWYTKRG